MTSFELPRKSKCKPLSLFLKRHASWLSMQDEAAKLSSSQLIEMMMMKSFILICHLTHSILAVAAAACSDFFLFAEIISKQTKVVQSQIRRKLSLMWLFELKRIVCHLPHRIMDTYCFDTIMAHWRWEWARSIWLAIDTRQPSCWLLAVVQVDACSCY